MDIIITISDEEKALLDSWLGEDKIIEWARHAVANKIRKRLNTTVMEHTNLNPKKLTTEAQFAAIKPIELPTKEERDGELNA